MRPFLFRTAILALICTATAQAVVLYGAGNSSNITNPGTGLPFDIVARVASSAGIEDGGSGVHLGSGFVITAAHIADNQLNSVTFDSSTFYSRDLSYSPVRIGQTDLKIFKLSTVPTVNSAIIYNGSSELLSNASLIGFGSGRADGTALNSNIVEFAPGGSPLIKRWGTNQPKANVSSFTYTRSSVTYVYDALETVLGNTAGNPADDGNGMFEAAAGPRDSGSGLFQFINGTWYLTGITSVITAQNSSPLSATFGNDVPAVITPGAGGSDSVIGLPGGAGDINLFVRLSSYQSQIAAVIPEPSSSLLLSIAFLGFSLRRRR